MTDQPPNGSPLPELSTEQLRAHAALRDAMQHGEASIAQTVVNLVRQMPPGRSNQPLEMTGAILGQLVGLMFPEDVGAAFINDVIYSAIERGRGFHAMKTDEAKIDVLTAILQPIAASERRIVLPGEAVH